MDDSIPLAELCDRYETLYTGIVADALDELGQLDQTFDRDIGPIDRQMTAAGIAFPALGRSNRSVNSNQQIRRFLRMLGDVPEHAILTINTNDTQSSQIGELTTRALTNATCRGVVTDGGVRDTNFILEQDFPVFTRFLTPADSVPRWELVSWGNEITIAGVSVAPGDVIIGDIDGVVVVPRDIAVNVLERAEEMVETEENVRNAIREGTNPLEAYEEYGTF